MDIGAQNYPAPKKAGPRQPPVPPSPRKEQASGHRNVPISGRGQSSQDAPRFSEPKEEWQESELATSSADDPTFALTPHPEEPLPQEDAPAPAETSSPMALRADTGAPPRANKGPNKMVPSPSPDSSDKAMESKTASPTDSPERLRGEAASGHRTITLENPLAREAEPAAMAVERATTPEGLPPRHAEDGAAVPKGSAPPNRGGAPGGG